MILDSIHFTCLLKSPEFPVETQPLQHATSDPQLSKNGSKPAVQSSTAQISKDSGNRDSVKRSGDSDSNPQEVPIQSTGIARPISKIRHGDNLYVPAVTDLPLRVANAWSFKGDRSAPRD